MVKSLWLPVTAALTVSNLTGQFSSAIACRFLGTAIHMSRGHEVQVRQQLVRPNDLKVLGHGCRNIRVRAITAFNLEMLCLMTCAQSCSTAITDMPEWQQSQPQLEQQSGHPCSHHLLQPAIHYVPYLILACSNAGSGVPSVSECQQQAAGKICEVCMQAITSNNFYIASWPKHPHGHRSCQIYGVARWDIWHAVRLALNTLEYIYIQQDL